MNDLTPQLAVDFDPKKAQYPLMGFQKIDGVRACHLTGGMTGRSMEPFKNKALVAKFADEVYTGYDGELTIDGLLTDEGVPLDEDGEIQSLCSATTGLTNRRKLRKDELVLPDNAVWNLFDLIDSQPTPYLERYENLVATVARDKPANVYVLPFVWINNLAEAEAWIQKCADDGLEGAIFRNPKAVHKSGRAKPVENEFWRWKPISDKDAICTGFEEAMENQNEAKINALGHTERSGHQENKVGKGMVGAILGTDVKTGKPIRVGPGKSTHKQRMAWFNDPTLIVGQPFKYTSLDVGVIDQPRQARFKTLRSREDMTQADLALIAQLGLS